MNYLKYINPGIDSIKPYEPGKSVDDVTKKYNLDKIIKLASNENSLGPSPKVIDVINNFKDIHLYPDGDGKKLKSKISEIEELSDKNIILGNGSNEILEIISQAFLSPRCECIFSKHAFVVYKLASKVRGSKFHEVEANKWGHDLEKFVGKINQKTRIIFIANPNNPTGTYLSHDSIINFLKKVPSEIIVVIDLAYYEYVIADDYIKPLEILKNFQNVLITKSFSKIHALSALRIGYGMGNEKLIEIMNRVRQPFNVNAIAQVAAIAALSDTDYLQKSIDNNTIEREFICECLDKMSVEYIPSQGNFICIDVKTNGTEIFESLMQKGVIVRPIELYDMPSFIRVTIGKRYENEFFIEKLKECL